MGGTKTKQQQTQNTTTANTYGWEQMPGTADIDAMRAFKFQTDPRLSYTFARAANRLKESYDNPLGGYMTAGLKDAQLRAGTEDLAQQEAQAYREEGHARQGLEFAKLADVAAMTQPRFVQTGGTSNSSGTGTTEQKQSPIGAIIGGASNVGSALLM